MLNGNIEIAYHLVCYFFIYGFVGWLWETCLCTVQERRFVNRGFLTGPVCPIYGFGMVIMLIFLYPLSSNPFLLFFGGLVISSALEYITGWALEMIFHATLWDYSDYKYNVNGRICPQVSFFWGVMSVVLMRLVHPFFREQLHNVPVNTGYIAATCLVAVLIADFVVSVVSVVNFRARLERLREIRASFREYLQSSNVYESAREWMQLINIHSDDSALDAIRRLGSRVVTSGAVAEEELAAQLAMLKVRYQKNTKLGFLHRRLTNAFPQAKFKGYKESFDDICDMLKKRYR